MMMMIGGRQEGSIGRRPLPPCISHDDNNKRVKLEELEEAVVNNNNAAAAAELALPLGFYNPTTTTAAAAAGPRRRQQQQRNRRQRQRSRRISRLRKFHNNDNHHRIKASSSSALVVVPNSRQFWKAGDYEGVSLPLPGNHNHPLSSSGTSSSGSGMDHARVHPKFLHSNATSHKWALGAFAELLDNAVDEVSNGATYVNVDLLMNNKNGDDSKMLLLQDNGGGMSPDKMRNCMSLGYSSKSKLANTIGQYGNGFKTSTMRLGADVIVFSSCKSNHGICPTRSIGMLSYTFLKSTRKEDTVVPMIDYEKKGHVWTQMVRSSSHDWHLNLDTITEWSPYSSEQELLHQFDYLDDQGTRIIIYNLWEDDMQQLELDFDTDPHDIQIRGVNRDEKKIAMARKYPNSRHFLTFHHSLRSYASILYLRLPPGFRILLRGEEVKHHNLANDLVHAKEVQYRPVPINDDTSKDPVSLQNIQVLVTLGFVKAAEDHMDIQGFNVYHKNRLIKPFWRVWNAAGSDGRGVIGLLEADFVEPAHDKQGFERTTALSRLEARLIVLQKAYWRNNCHLIGYAPRTALNKTGLETSLPVSRNSNTPNGKAHTNNSSVDDTRSPHFEAPTSRLMSHSTSHVEAPTSRLMSHSTSHFEAPTSRRVSHLTSKISRSDGKDDAATCELEKRNGPTNICESVQGNGKVVTTCQPERKDMQTSIIVAKLTKENLELKKRLEDAKKASKEDDLKQQVEVGIEKCKSLETKLEEANMKIVEMEKEQETLIEIFAEERDRRDVEEEDLRKRLTDACKRIEELVEEKTK